MDPRPEEKSTPKCSHPPTSGCRFRPRSVIVGRDAAPLAYACPSVRSLPEPRKKGPRMCHASLEYFALAVKEKACVCAVVVSWAGMSGR